jgi:uncharacterized membrane protein (DUF485 family)
LSPARKRHLAVDIVMGVLTALILALLALLIAFIVTGVGRWG